MSRDNAGGFYDSSPEVATLETMRTDLTAARVSYLRRGSGLQNVGDASDAYVEAVVDFQRERGLPDGLTSTTPLVLHELRMRLEPLRTRSEGRSWRQRAGHMGKAFGFLAAGGGLSMLTDMPGLDYPVGSMLYSYQLSRFIDKGEFDSFTPSTMIDTPTHIPPSLPIKYGVEAENFYLEFAARPSYEQAQKKELRMAAGIFAVMSVLKAASL